MARRLFAAGAVAGVLAASACGGGDRLSNEEYQGELDEATSQVQDAFARLSESAQQVSSGSGSLDAVADVVGNIQDELATAADDLEDVTPPRAVEAAHDRLVHGMRGFSDDLDDFRGAIEEGDAAAIEDFSSRAEKLESTKELRAATNELEKHGFRIRMAG